MPANQSPIYSRLADVQWSSAALINGSTETNITNSSTTYIVFTSDATNGGYIQKLRFKPVPTVSTLVTVGRVWINNGLTSTNAVNSVLYDDISLPVATGSSIASTPSYEMPLNFALPAGYRLIVTLGATMGTSTGWNVTAVAGKY